MNSWKGYSKRVHCAVARPLRLLFRKMDEFGHFFLFALRFTSIRKSWRFVGLSYASNLSSTYFAITTSSSTAPYTPIPSQKSFSTPLQPHTNSYTPYPDTQPSRCLPIFGTSPSYPRSRLKKIRPKAIARLLSRLWWSCIRMTEANTPSFKAPSTP